MLLELLDPQPAASSPAAATAAAVPSHLERFICIVSSVVVLLGAVRSCRGRFPEVTGGEQLAPLAEFGGGAFQRDPPV